MNEKLKRIVRSASGAYQRVPEILRTALISAAVGLLLWGVMSYTHASGIEEVLQQELIEDLQREAVNGRINFTAYVASFHDGVRLITAQKVFVDYIGKMPLSGAAQKTRPSPVMHTDFPPWLPAGSLPRQYARFCYAFLLDERMKPVEVYTGPGCGKEPPDALLNPSEMTVRSSAGQSQLTNIEGVDYVVSSDTVYDAGGGVRAILMTASPLDSEFLKLSQMSDETDFIVALLEGKDSHVTASSRADAVPPGAGLEDIRKDYIVMVKEFLDFGYSDLELKYATIFSKKDAFARRNVILSKGTTDHVLYSSILSLLLFAALMYKRSMRGMKSALQTIVSSKEYMENIMSSLNDGIIVVSRKGDVMMLNAAASQLLGYEEKELAGRPLCELLPDAPSERTLDGAGDAVTLAQESAGGSIKRYEASCVSKSGVVIPVMVSRSLLEDKFGLVLGFVIVLQDITRRKQAEDTIRHNYILQQVINLVLELSLRPVSMDTLAAECLDLIISVPKLHTEKKGSIHLVGDEPEVLIMKAQRGLSKEILDSCAVLPFGKCLCGRAALKREIIFDDHVGDDHEIRFDGMTPHGHYCAPIISGDRVLGVINLYVRAGHVKTDSETHFLSSIANALAGVIERKQAESELLKARDNLERKAAELEKTNSELKETTGQLVQSGKLSALGELTAGVAHELNQPLNGIKIICQSILRDIEKGRHDEAELCDDLKQIVGQVNKMAEIIDHMRIFTRRSEGMLTEMLDINKVVRSPFIFLGQQLKNNNIEVVLELAEGLPQVKGDAIRLEQVFMNLITNAKNAMEKIGDRPRRLTIRTLSCDGSAGLQAGLQDGAGVCVEFQDNGSGIPTDLIEKIFQPFFTTNEPGKGTGLGLSLSNKIVQEHGGRVLVESEAGVGTLFRVLLPAGPNNPASIIKEEIDA